MKFSLGLMCGKVRENNDFDNNLENSLLFSSFFYTDIVCFLVHVWCTN